MKLNQMIRIKISEEDDCFLNNAITEIKRTTGIKTSKPEIVRMCISEYVDYAEVIKNGKNLERIKNDDVAYEHFNSLSKSFDIRKISSGRKEGKNKAYKDDKLSSHEEIKKSISLRVSDKQRTLIEEHVSSIKKSSGIFISISDFVRFCIRSEREYMKMNGWENI